MFNHKNAEKRTQKLFLNRMETKISKAEEISRRKQRVYNTKSTTLEFRSWRERHKRRKRIQCVFTGGNGSPTKNKEEHKKSPQKKRTKDFLSENVGKGMGPDSLAVIPLPSADDFERGAVFVKTQKTNQMRSAKCGGRSAEFSENRRF